MNTTDNKNPTLRIDFDEDVSVLIEVTFKGDVRNLFNDLPEGTTREDAELQVAGNLFSVIGAAAGASTASEDGATEADDREVLK